MTSPYRYRHFSLLGSLFSMSMTKFSLTHLGAWRFTKWNEFFSIPVVHVYSFASSPNNGHLNAHTAHRRRTCGGGGKGGAPHWSDGQVVKCSHFFARKEICKKKGSATASCREQTLLPSVDCTGYASSSMCASLNLVVQFDTIYLIIIGI